MKILGIDYGRRKVGLAIAEGSLAAPFKVLSVESFDDAIEKVKKLLQVLQVEKAVVGVSEGEMGEEQKEFARVLGAETFDETLTTQDAQKLSIEAGISRKKRRGMEDAYAASVMLQNYLDQISHNH